MIGGTTLAAGGIIAASLSFATGGHAGVAAPTPTSTPLAALVAPAQPEPIVRGDIIATDGVTAGAAEGLVTGGTVVTVHGTDLGSVASVSFGGNAGQLVAVTDDAVTISTPPATGLLEGTVPVELFDVKGAPVPVTSADAADAAAAAPADPAAPAAGETTPIVPEDAAADTKATDTKATDKKAADAKATDKKAAASGAGDAASVTGSALALSFSYVPDPRVTAQMDYAMTYWDNYNTDVYGVIPGNDCVNFTSQSLVARGWVMDAEWWFDPASKATSAPWNSSTAFAAYMDSHPERGTALTDDQRAEVKVGDVVQFDWNLSGDRDHTAIVSKVVKSEAGVEIYYAGHTADTEYKSVDESLANTGGSVSYWSIT